MDKSVLITGANGFLGTIVREKLKQLEYDIKTLGRSTESDYPIDLANEIPSFERRFGIVVHAAGKAHVAVSAEHPAKAFWQTNLDGTLHLLSALEEHPPAAFVFISTVAVYGQETGTKINEEAPLLATDPYGQSKIAAEKAVQDWCAVKNVSCSILRLPLVAGPHPPGNLHEMIIGIQNGRYAHIGGGRARKSIVLASDVAAIIPAAANSPGIYNLTDGHHPSFLELSVHIASQLGNRKLRDIPFWFARLIAWAGDFSGGKLPINSVKFRKITLDLTFDDAKARAGLNWNPTPVLQGFKIQ